MTISGARWPSSTGARGVDGRAAWFARGRPQADQPRADGGGFDCDHALDTKLKYADPYPLSAKYFLCSRMTGRGWEMGIYLVDVFGNEVLLHVEGRGCYDPMPLQAAGAPAADPLAARLRERGGLLLRPGRLPGHPHAGRPARRGEDASAWWRRRRSGPGRRASGLARATRRRG